MVHPRERYVMFTTTRGSEWNPGLGTRKITWPFAVGQVSLVLVLFLHHLLDPATDEGPM